MYLIIDNYDSFVFNLADYIHQLGYATKVIYQDQVTPEIVKHLNPRGIIISPGPKHPKDIPNVIEIIQYCAGHYPILGICLGHQAIGYAFEAHIQQTKPAHGFNTMITHTETGLFDKIPQQIKVGRYHALSIMRDINFPECFNITAETIDTQNTPIIMGIQHKLYPIYGLQFHPESILTEYGLDILKNFVSKKILSDII